MNSMNNTDRVLSYLEDEESRFIYRKKVEYNETGEFNAIKVIVDKYLPQLADKKYYPGMVTEMLTHLKDKRKIVLFGSGMNGKAVLRYLIAHKIGVECFADNDENKKGVRVEGVEVKHPRDIDYTDVDAIVVTPYEQIFVDEIRRQLTGLGAKENTLLNFKDYCPTMLEWEQYFDSKIIKLHEGEVFIDAGVLNLGTSLRFIEECGRRKVKRYKIHAFEPDNTSYARCMNMLKNMPDEDIQLYNAGLWSENTTLFFTEMGNGASRITQQETETSIHAVALDSQVSDKVTFIKMDIEGAELEALKGCREIIKRDKPRLAICIYHKKEDLTEIPMYIKELVPEYKLYVRHYSNDAGETVLYAVMEE